MNVLLVSQCGKKALVETRRIIDQFAERRGDRTWQTPITAAGLDTLRRLLKKTARRNTAVACHWIRAKNHTELMWVVGNQSKFNEQGAVPTNITRRDILKQSDENDWHSGEDIALLAAIAALFHDFGKANRLFQIKLEGEGKGPQAEPYRHEWVSLRMFEAFVGGLSDAQWLKRLAEVCEQDSGRLLENLIADHPDKKSKTPFHPKSALTLPPTARAVGWLILTHHKLPLLPEGSEDYPDMDNVGDILNEEMSADWISPQILYFSAGNKVPKAAAKDLKAVWDLAGKTPILSRTWRAKARRVGKRALKRLGFADTHWLEDTFSLHLARLALMLADHYYSSLSGNDKYRDDTFTLWANTDREQQGNPPKQRLDEHLIGVYRSSLNVVRLLPQLKDNLPAISQLSELKKRSPPQYRWQNKAYDLARSVATRSEQQGFFGINMASTGQGKTFANARIMYGLSDPRKGCRFGIALGLRTLTLQTGDALSERLKLCRDDIAVLIGSQAVLQLYEQAKSQDKKTPFDGAESRAELMDERQAIDYDGISGTILAQWLKKSGKLDRMVSAPILVSTIDHLMPATESQRGGRQIAPILRLLSSDLVIDEIDDFDMNDLPAICRLVNWAGLFGARVLLSSATLPPVLVSALFDAYAAGRAQYRRVRGVPGIGSDICCAWFDEFCARSHAVADKDQLLECHCEFVDRRVSRLRQVPPVRCAELLSLTLDNASLPPGDNPVRKAAAVDAMAQTIYDAIVSQHHRHYQSRDGQHISVGLVRMANIKPLVAVAKALLTRAAPSDTAIHYCVYHSQFPLVMRSAIERQLDNVLLRDEPFAIWHHPSIVEPLQHSTAAHHIFVVLGSPVCEVGRDHDYDWAVVEPSSMRSIIQLAGRVQRHRQQVAETPNITLLSHNFKGLCGARPTFTRPGFETDKRRLKAIDLYQLLVPEQYRSITALERIRPSQTNDPAANLAAFEHVQLAETLTDGEPAANIWWQAPLHLTYEWQRRSRFRRSAPSEDFVLLLDEQDESILFEQWHPNGERKPVNNRFERPPEVRSELANGIYLWGDFNYARQVAELAKRKQQDLFKACLTYGGVSLPGSDKQLRVWCFDESLGFYQAL